MNEFEAPIISETELFAQTLASALRTGDINEVIGWQETFTDRAILLHNFPEQGTSSQVTPGDLRAQFGSCTVRYYFEDNASQQKGHQPKQFTLTANTLGRLSLIPADTERREP